MTGVTASVFTSGTDLRACPSFFGSQMRFVGASATSLCLIRKTDSVFLKDIRCHAVIADWNELNKGVRALNFAALE